MLLRMDSTVALCQVKIELRSNPSPKKNPGTPFMSPEPLATQAVAGCVHYLG